MLYPSSSLLPLSVLDWIYFVDWHGPNVVVSAVYYTVPVNQIMQYWQDVRLLIRGPDGTQLVINK